MADFGRPGMDAPAEVLAGYRLLRVVGRGGMSVVYLAEEVRLGRRVALKLLRSPVSNDDTYRQRFIKETRTIAAIEHPNIVPVYDAGEVDEFLFLAMRYVEGATLGDVIRHTGALESARAASILDQICSALDTAHAMGVIHRDVKPANILIDSRRTESDHAYLCDFGLSKRALAPPSVTAVGQMVGTVHYAAPEQIEGRPVDERTDVYSLGCVFYESLTGKVPFERSQDVAVLMAHLRDQPPVLRTLRPDLPEELEAVIARAMAKAPGDRYRSCTDLARAARRALGRKTKLPVAPPQQKLTPPASQPPAVPSPQITARVPNETLNRRRAAVTVVFALLLFLLALLAVGVRLTH